MSSIISTPAASSAASAGSTTGSTSTSAASDPLANESTFLTLLVSQLQNQDPTSPMDSNQFVSQLTSYSQLEQLIGIHKDTTSLTGDSSTTSTAAGATASTTTSTSTTQTGN